MSELILTFDIGTTGVKATIFNETLEKKGSVYKQYPTFYPKNNFVEQRPEDWWEKICESSKEVIAITKIKPKDVSCISFSGHMLGAIPISTKGKLLREKVPIWADARSSKQVEKVFKNLGGYENFYNITGGGHQPELYSIFKVLWYKDNEKEIYEQADKFLQSKDFIINRMTDNKNVVTDYSDASLTGALDMYKLKWSDEIFSAAGLSSDIFPEPRESSSVVGKLSTKSAELLGLIEGIPIVVGAGDGACAAAGAGAIGEGVPYLYIGSASWFGISSEEPVMDFDTKIVLIKHMVPGRYVPLYVMYSGGICQQWFIEEFLDLENETLKKFDKNIYNEISKKAENLSADMPLIFLPYMRGGGAPYQDPNARGTMIGLELKHKKAHEYRAILEGIAYNIRLLINGMEKHAGYELGRINVIGGGAKNEFWLQLISSICKREVQKLLLQQESNCLGAAIAGGVGINIFNDYHQAEKIIKYENLLKPQKESYNAYDKKYVIFTKAYRQLASIFKELNG